jgi:hypothetical protein
MKSLAKLLVTLSTIFCTSSYAGSSYTPGNTGLGITVGDFGGLTFFHKLDQQSFVQAYISSHFLVGSDYAVTFPNAFPTAPALLPYVGGGGFLFSTRYWSIYDNHGHSISGIGAKLPIGMLIQIPNAPVHIHAEISPACTLTPFVESFLAVQVGARFLF